MRISARLIICYNLPMDGIDGEEFIGLTSPTGTIINCKPNADPGHCPEYTEA